MLLDCLDRVDKSIAAVAVFADAADASVFPCVPSVSYPTLHRPQHGIKTLVYPFVNCIVKEIFVLVDLLTFLGVSFRFLFLFNDKRFFL